MAKERSHRDDGKARRAARAATARAAMERAILEMTGELGYHAVAVEPMLARAATNRARFYSEWPDKARCFEAAYAAALDDLVARLLAPCAEAPYWAAGMRLALTALARFVDAEPALARGVLSEAGAAGAANAAKRKEVLERLSRAIDRARRETREPRHSPPPFTSRFILGAIEAAVLKFLAAPERKSFGEEVPGLLGLAVGFYLGPEAARAEVRRLAGEN